MDTLILLMSGLLAAGEVAMPASYVRRVERAIDTCRADIPAMQPPADQAAARLAAGGKLWAAGQPSMVSEISGRAGGFMMIRSLGDNVPGNGDVVLYTPEHGVPVPRSLADTKAMAVAFGECPREPGFVCLPNHAEANRISPTLANALPAWIFTGELIAALTRLGKTPVIFESIGAYAGNARIQQYKNGEIAFHDDMKVSPVPAGVIGNRFVDIIGAKLRQIEEEQRANLDRAGAWAREARKQGKQLFMYSMGHIFPDEVGKTKIGEVFRSAVWNAGFRHPHPEDTYAPGDVAVLIGYQQPADELLRKARPAGARVVYVTVRADRDFTKDPDVIWIDPMWDWPDACVPLEGYDVPLLAASGILNGAIAWEIYRLATGDEAP
jgi:hypothetical protein